MHAFRTMLGPSDMLAYLSMVAPRLVELRRVMTPTGSVPRIQLLTIRELLDNRRIDYLHVTGANITHRRAQRARTHEAEALPLFRPDPTGE